MSNVIKFWGANDNESGVVINSNQKADAFFMELQKLQTERLKKEIAEAKALKENEDKTFQRLKFEEVSLPEVSSKEEDEAKARAEEILEDASTESELIIEKALEEARLQEEEIRKRAIEEGYQEGYERGLREFEEKKEELRLEKERLQAEYAEEIERLEPVFTDLVIKYVERLTGIMADDYESIIYNLITMAIKNTEPSRNYLIHVPKEQYMYVLSQEDYLKEIVGEYATVEIVSDSSLTVNSCKIETDSYVIDTGLDTRLATLINSLKLLSENENK